MHRLSSKVMSAITAMCLAGGIWIPGTGTAAGGDWPGWRCDGNGISSDKNLPVYWDAETNIVWKSPLPGEGNSSPIVFGDRTFLTASTEKGKKRHVICLNSADGRVIWQKDLVAQRIAKTDPKNGYASPTPVTDGKNVYAFFDSPGLVALDMDGNVVWTRDFGPFNNIRNMASSPVLCDGMVIVNCDHDGDSFIAAVDCSSGDLRWKTPRNTPRQWASPLVIAVEGKKQIVVDGATVVAYDSDNGRIVWTCRGMKVVVTPSTVFDGGLVYATSGRNGPSMAIDPSGYGDISETHVMMHFAIGGPYVPSPVVYPYLFLPGDNGTARFIDRNGEAVVTERVRGHFSSSPVAGDNKIYWTSEKGDTYVMDVSRVAGDRPEIEVLAVNRLGEKVLASPAIANGCLYIRTDKHLFCIAGDDKVEAPAVTEAPVRTFAELKKLYDDHPAPEGDDPDLRLEIVEELGRRKALEAIPFLREVAEEDDQWDVSEEAVKVLGFYGEAAVPALIELLESGDWRPYLKIVPAGHVGRMKSASAVPALLKLVRHQDSLVRIASLKALAQIASTRDAEAAKVIPALTSALGDQEGMVKREATAGIRLLAGKLGEHREAIAKTLLDLTAEKNQIVAEQAHKVLRESLGVPAEVIAKDELLYGEQRKDPVMEYVNAGPISLKFQDGELRYLRVGGKEIVRRIYFAVRDTRWDTAMPKFSKLDIQTDKDRFEISMEATSRNDIADYSWRGLIVGTADGKITFSVSGEAGTDFKSPRVGINVLYGAESLAGQRYELIDEMGGVTEGEFPRLVSQDLLARSFRTLRYTTADGMQVIASLGKTHFGMEDQRNYGDSSYKAFSGMPYQYPDLVKGERGDQELTLEVKNARPEAETRGVASVVVGAPVEGARMPKLLSVEQSVEGADFLQCNRDRQQYTGAELIALRFNPSLHMPDDDTFMENIPAICDQVVTIRSFAPTARFRVDPIALDSPYPRPGPDPRNRGQFAAAWCARMVKYLALAGVEEAVFNVGLGHSAELVQKVMAPYAGRTVLSTDVGPHAAIDVLALDDAGRRVIYLINKTDRPQRLLVDKLGDAAKAKLLRLNASAPLTSGLGPPQEVAVKNGQLSLDLDPFEVCIMTETR